MSTQESALMEYSPEFGFETFEFGQQEWSGESEIFSEAELMELAGELLEINSEAELDRFLGNIIKKAGGFIRSPVGRAIGGALKGLAKKALPFAGTALGGLLGPAGAMIGGKLASVAANALEMETLEAEDREFEGAKQFARMCGEAAKTALSAPANVNPQVAAQQAVTAAAAKFAPVLTERMLKKPSVPAGRQTAVPSGPGQHGRWVRKGSSIVLLNAA